MAQAFTGLLLQSDNPLTNGVDWLYVLVFVALSAVFLGATLYFFERRDLAV